MTRGIWMTASGLEQLWPEIARLPAVHAVGRVCELGRGVVGVTGLAQAAALGDLVRIEGSGRPPMQGEVIRLNAGRATVLPAEEPSGLSLGDRVILGARAVVAPSDAWIGRIVDPDGQPLDARPLLRGPTRRELLARPPAATQRQRLGQRLETGIGVFNTLLPLVRGQRIGLFAGSGVGKSSLLGRFARGVAADVVVLALIGERGRELRDFVEEVLGPQGLERSVVVAATSDQSPVMRRRCAWTAMAVAEHFRDEGREVLLLADSITRFAEAHREIALTSGEPASLRGYPPSTAHQITALAERAGPGGPGQGAITAVLSVLVAGSDMEEPVADILRGVLDGHVVMERRIAERGRFPAIDVLRSVSRALPAAASAEENRVIQRTRELLAAWEGAEMMVQAGLYAHGSDPTVDAALQCRPAIEGFLGSGTTETVAESFARLALCLGPEWQGPAPVGK